MAGPLLFVALVLCFPLSSSSADVLSEGSSLSVEKVSDFLTSLDGTFGAGFHPVGQNAYCFAIWFNKPPCRDNCTLVWMANRDHPINGRQSKLSLTKTGKLILTDATRIIAWETNTASLSPTHLKLYGTGNLVLHDLEGAKLWQSFDSPTDTLLPLQHFSKDSKLVSSRSQNNYSSGFFSFYFDTDNVLCLLYDGPEVSSVYWPNPSLLRMEAGRSNYNDSRIAVLDSLGNFSSSDDFTFMSADYGSLIQRRLKLDYDGSIRLYSLSEGGESWVVSWQSFPQPCLVHGSCGPNSICSFIPSYGRKCSCIPGHKMKDHTDWSLGCEPEFDLSCNGSDVGFLKLGHSEFYSYNYGLFPNYTLDRCKNLCLEVCDCKGFQFIAIGTDQPYTTYCYPKTQLWNGHREPSYGGEFYLKFPKAPMSSYNNPRKDYKLECSARVEQLNREYPKRLENSSLKIVLWCASVIGGIEIFIIFGVWYFLIRTRQDSRPIGGYHLAVTNFRKFTYAELDKATNCFKKEIGRGAGGIVYKAKLADDRIAAIKRLIDANHGEAEFLAEVNTIGRLNHMNLIDLWGYCVEGKHRLLVYEYMEHGSLAENLSCKTLDWKKRFQIAVGTARGLAYIHEECLEWILHCDIKPQNILIDSNYQPKVSDFGLAWLLNRGDVKYSKISRLRGTRGYMAPEWVLNMPITSKVDVYSYGIVLLELITGRSPSMGVHGIDGKKVMQRTLSKWGKDQTETDITETRMGMIVDPTLEGKYDEAEMSVLVKVALQCVQEDRDARPTMGEVVQMLLHLVEIQ
ncbi:putative receptor protein kinase ZmPK1 [Hibiscus syriacus]|nr:putative receptor protein kinase ZmPK1 [Hibiscus syriacus]